MFLTKLIIEQQNEDTPLFNKNALQGMKINRGVLLIYDNQIQKLISGSHSVMKYITYDAFVGMTNMYVG